MPFGIKTVSPLEYLFSLPSSVIKPSPSIIVQTSDLCYGIDKKFVDQDPPQFVLTCIEVHHELHKNAPMAFFNFLCNHYLFELNNTICSVSDRNLEAR